MDQIFSELLRQACLGALTIEDITNLNNRVVSMLKLDYSLNNIVIVHRNKTRHLINWLQIERYVCFVGRDIIIFSALYTYTKKLGNKAILYKTLFSL